MNNVGGRRAVDRTFAAGWYWISAIAWQHVLVADSAILPIIETRKKSLPERLAVPVGHRDDRARASFGSFHASRGNEVLTEACLMADL